MKIGQKQTLSNPRASWLIGLALVFALGLFLGGRDPLSPVQYWLPSLPLSLGHQSSVDHLPTLTVDMPFDSYRNLLQQREAALRAGGYLSRRADFVMATIRLRDSVVPVNVRFRDGTAQHLEQAQGWQFDVRARQDQTLNGMERFYLLDPADNNWLNQWAFARSLEREGILTARYAFVNLVFNGHSWGTYALQEGFGDALMTRNDRVPGVLLAFDTDLLWRSIARFGDAEHTYADPVGKLTSTAFPFLEVDAFSDAAIDRDVARSNQRDVAVSRMRALQAGQVPPSEVFDVETYARFLSLVDLWGANEAVSVANLRYYYDPDTGRVEPIGFVGNPLSSEERLPMAATHGDTGLQAAYAREAKRVSDPSYLDGLRAELEEDLLRLQRILQRHAGEMDLPWEALEQRQAWMRHSIDPIQPVFAYLGDATTSVSATIEIDVANVVNLPIEVIGFDINGTTFLEADPAWLRTDPNPDLVIVRGNQLVLIASSSNTPRYVRFHLPTTEIVRLDAESHFMQPTEIGVATRILGLDRHQLTPAREGAPDSLVAP